MIVTLSLYGPQLKWSRSHNQRATRVARLWLRALAMKTTLLEHLSLGPYKESVASVQIQMPQLDAPSALRAAHMLLIQPSCKTTIFVHVIVIISAEIHMTSLSTIQNFPYAFHFAVFSAQFAQSFQTLSCFPYAFYWFLNGFRLSYTFFTQITLRFLLGSEDV